MSLKPGPYFDSICLNRIDMALTSQYQIIVNTKYILCYIIKELNHPNNLVLTENDFKQSVSKTNQSFRW